MPDEILELLGDVFVKNNIGIFRKITFVQFVERFKDDPTLIKSYTEMNDSFEFHQR